MNEFSSETVQNKEQPKKESLEEQEQYFRALLEHQLRMCSDCMGRSYATDIGETYERLGEYSNAIVYFLLSPEKQRYYRVFEKLSDDAVEDAYKEAILRTEKQAGFLRDYIKGVVSFNPQDSVFGSTVEDFRSRIRQLDEMAENLRNEQTDKVWKTWKNIFEKEG